MLLGMTAFVWYFWMSFPLDYVKLVYIYIGEYGYMRNGGDSRWCIYSGRGGNVSKGVSVGEVGEMDRIASISCS
jgi:hypothetical protein